MGSSFTAPNEMRNSSRWYKAEIEGAAPECDESSLNKKHSSVAIVATRAIEQRAFAHPTRLPRPSRPGVVPTLVGHSTARPLTLFRYFHESFLNELCRPCHGVCVDLDAGKQVPVDPSVRLRGRTTQLDLHAAFHLVGDETLVGIAGCYVPVGIVGGIVQRHVAGVGVKYRDDLGLGFPIGDIILDELKVEYRCAPLVLKRSCLGSFRSGAFLTR